jgi:SAM-dependent methyltransferase
MSITVYHSNAHVPPEHLRPAIDRCPVCLSTTARGAVWRVQDDPVVDYLECRDCGACSTSAMPSDAFLEEFYRRQYYSEADAAVTFRGVDRFCRHILRSVKFSATPDGTVSILDFGGGDGAVSRGIARRLVDTGRAAAGKIVVVDYAATARSDDPRVTVAAIQRLGETKGPFDLVLASAILEHIPFVHDTLRDLFARIAPGGFFYARTPYNLPLVRVYRGYNLLFPAHVHDMGIKFWNRVLDTSALPGRLVASRPSIVESELREDFFRTLVAYAFKFPARVELALTSGRRERLLWPFVGGWEVVIRRAA